MSTQTDFIDKVKQQAIYEWNTRHILASITIAQAILESGWGSSLLTQRGNNLFGIKVSSGWTGGSVSMKTTEYRNGSAYQTNALFRSYGSWSESITDHTSFLLNNSRYANLIGDSDAQSVANKLHEDGYATDPNYASLLMSLVNTYNLTQYDGQTAQNNTTPDPIPDKVTDEIPDTGDHLMYGTVTAKSGLNVRNGHSFSSAKIGSLEYGKTVRLGVLVGSWWNIYYGNHGGWVHKDYIRLI